VTRRLDHGAVANASNHEIFGIDFPGSAARFERLEEMLG
jgi:hypothetical protein